MIRKYFLLLTVSATVLSAQAQNEFKAVENILDSVNPDSIKRHIAWLADDKLKGRPAGSEGYQMAVDYVIAHYKQFGLKPAGENNTYLQEVKLREATVDAVQSQFSLSGIDRVLVFGDDYVVNPHFEEERVSVDAPLVFAGYGIHAPEFGYDDYEGLDVKGKVVVIVLGAPDKFPSTVKAHFMNRTTISQAAFEHGAAGVLIKVSNTISLKNSGIAVTSSGINTALTRENKMFDFSSRGAGGLGLQFFGLISHKLFMEIVKSPEEEVTKALSLMKEGTPSRIDIQSQAKASVVSRHKTFVSYNVVGVIPGTDQKLKKEYVVHSAHLDHVGISKPVNGDSINNGAHDNASGVSATLEVARLYSTVKKKPRRSILFVMLTGEELGLLGSTYFSQFPTVDRSSMVANVNMDMPVMIAPMLSIIPLGAQHSSLINQVKKAGEYLDMEIENDPEPEQNSFVRSDQYSFVREGIPALNTRIGNKTAVPGKSQLADVKKWRADFYHKPQDQLEGGIFDFNGGKKFVQFNFLVSWQVAQAKERPVWNEGDFFGRDTAVQSKQQNSRK